MAFAIYVTPEDIAPEFDQEPAELFNVLELIAHDEPAEMADFADKFAEAWSGSQASNRVLPLLRQMVDALALVSADPEAEDF